MKNHWIKTFIAVMLAGLFTVPATAKEDHTAQYEQRLAETKARLNLSDQQMEQIEPTLEAGFTASQAILQKYGINPENRDNRQRLGFRKARQLRKELQTVQINTLHELSDVLTDEQLAEYREIQAERKAELKQRIFQPRGANRDSQQPGKNVMFIQHSNNKVRI